MARSRYADDAASTWGSVGTMAARHVEGFRTSITRLSLPLPFGRSALSGWMTAPVLLLAVVLATWPTALRFDTEVAIGAFLPATRAVPEHGAWQLWWVADRLAHAFRGFADAPNFYPHLGTAFYSEPQAAMGVLLAPLWYLGVTPTVIVNTAAFLTLFLNGFFALRVATALGGSRDTALACGVLTVGLPFVYKDINALNLVSVFGLLWYLDGVVRFASSGLRRWALWSGLGLFVSFHCCMTYFVMFVPLFVGAWLVALWQQDFSRRSLLASVVGLGPFASGIFMSVIAIWDVHSLLSNSRSLDMVAALSARPADWLRRHHLTWLNLPPGKIGDATGLFPGVILSGALVASLLLVWRAKPQRGWWLLWLAMAALCVVLSFGPKYSVLDAKPYGVLSDILPGLDRIRSAYRYATITHLLLPLLALPALQQLSRRAPRWHLAPALALAATIESLPAAMPTTAIRTPVDEPWVEWLRSQKEDSAILHVPMLFIPGVNYTNEELETGRMLMQTRHGRRMVNGYSGFVPQKRAPTTDLINNYWALEYVVARQFPSKDLVCYLKQAGVDFIVADSTWAGNEKMRQMVDLLEVRHADAQQTIYSYASGGCSP